MVICLERGADLHTAQRMPLPLTVSCFSKIQIGFTFLVPAHLGSPGQKAVKRVCVYPKVRNNIGGIFPLISPKQNIGGCVLGIPSGVDASASNAACFTQVFVHKDLMEAMTAYLSPKHFWQAKFHDYYKVLHINNQTINNTTL